MSRSCLILSIWAFYTYFYIEMLRLKLCRILNKIVKLKTFVSICSCIGIANTLGNTDCFSRSVVKICGS